MGISITGQAIALMGAIALGIGVGLLYDLLRLLRRWLHNSVFSYLLDLLFWLCVTTAMFLFCLSATGGQVRLYVMLALFGGAVIYFLTLSAWVLSLGALLADLLAQFCHILLFPFHFLANLAKVFYFFFKNTFHYWKKWFKIRNKLKGKEFAFYQKKVDQKEGKQHAHRKGRIHD